VEEKDIISNESHKSGGEEYLRKPLGAGNLEELQLIQAEPRLRARAGEARGLYRAS
jgi:hypothetical protein